MHNEDWIGLLAADPRPWILASGEPAARLVTLTHLLDQPASDPEVLDAREKMLAEPGTRELLDRLPDWEADNNVSGHNSPGFAPNLLHLLADMGIQGGDDARIERLLDAMLRHQTDDGCFTSYGRAGYGAIGSLDHPVWGCLLCDAHAITEVLVRFHRGDDPRIRTAIRKMAADLCRTNQGWAYLCLPHSVSGFRGPGRKADFCPQVTLEALRTFARLPVESRPPACLEAARVILRAWRMRGEEKPYMFGHGYKFKTVKWPTTWYDLHWVLDTLGRFPELWQQPVADAADRRSLAEMVACLVAYNFGPSGMVTPRSCYNGFANFSFGQKKHPSPFATARLAAVLRRFNDLAGDVRDIDVARLPGSKGGSGTVVPPKKG